jgi:PAS domain S-box-containing protein
VFFGSADKKPPDLSKKRVEGPLLPSADSLLDSLPVPVFFEDRRGRCLGCNGAFEELTGRTREDLLGKIVSVRKRGKPSGTSVGKKDGPIIRTEEGVLTDGQGNSGKVVFRTAALRDSRGRPAGRVCVVWDMTELRKEETLRKSLGRYRTLLDGIEDGYYETDLKGNLTFFNRGLTAITGYSPGEMTGMNYRVFMDRHNGNLILDIFREAFRTGRPTRAFDWEIIRKDGTKAVIEASISLIPGEGDRPSGFRGIIRDITKRKGAEKALRESREELKKNQEELERIVQSRTEKWKETNERLLREIREREKTEKSLRERERELNEQSRFLEEVNTALRVILNQRERDQVDFQGNILANVRELILPYLDRLKSDHLSESQRTCIQVIESNLKNILSPFITNTRLNQLNLTHSEIRIANLIRNGKSTKEIAQILGLSERTIEAHRDRIRDKLHLRGKRSNLRAHLVSLD